MARIASKKSPKRKRNIGYEIIDAIISESNEGKETYLLDYDKGCAILLKKHPVEVRVLKNNHPTCMQPIEAHEKRTFFHFFVICWDAKKIKNLHPRTLERIGFPFISVSSVHEALTAIRNQ